MHIIYGHRLQFQSLDIIIPWQPSWSILKWSDGDYSAIKVMLRQASSGTGVIAGGVAFRKQLGSTNRLTMLEQIDRKEFNKKYHHAIFFHSFPLYPCFLFFPLCLLC